MKDLHNNIEIESILDPVAVSATATHSDIDLQNFNSAELVISVGVDSGLSGSDKLVFTLKDSDDGDTYTAVETDDMLGVTVTSGVILTIDSTDEDNTIYKFGYVGGKRYLELKYTVSGTVSLPMGIALIKSHGLDVPAIS